VAIDVPNPPPLKEDAVVLALSGGGMRGLFTAAALARLEEKVSDLAARFTLIAGTSIGGILAIGLAVGVKAAVMEKAIRDHGPTIFRRRLPDRIANPKRLFAAGYRPEPLEAAIRAILGAAADRTLGEVTVPLLVTAVELNQGMARIFASKPVAQPGDDLKLRLVDVALATSAAPTYFPPHSVGGRHYVDGGLIANSPDIVALQRARFRQGVPERKIRLLSVGTASYEKRRDQRLARSGGIAWLRRHDLIGLTLDAQADLSRAQARSFLGNRFYRLDRLPERPIELDDASEARMALLARLADEAVARFEQDRAAWRTFFG